MDYCVGQDGDPWDADAVELVGGQAGRVGEGDGQLVFVGVGGTGDGHSCTRQIQHRTRTSRNLHTSKIHHKSRPNLKILIRTKPNRTIGISNPKRHNITIKSQILQITQIKHRFILINKLIITIYSTSIIN